MVEEVREPIVDVFDEGEHLTIIAELPGVEESDIHLEVKGDILDITTQGRIGNTVKKFCSPQLRTLLLWNPHIKTGLKK